MCAAERAYHDMQWGTHISAFLVHHRTRLLANAWICVHATMAHSRSSTEIPRVILVYSENGPSPATLIVYHTEQRSRFENIFPIIVGLTANNACHVSVSYVHVSSCRSKGASPCASHGQVWTKYQSHTYLFPHRILLLNRCRILGP